MYVYLEYTFGVEYSKLMTWFGLIFPYKHLGSLVNNVQFSWAPKSHDMNFGRPYWDPPKSQVAGPKGYRRSLNNHQYCGLDSLYQYGRGHLK